MGVPWCYQQARDTTPFSSPWVLPEMATTFINRKLRAIKKNRKGQAGFSLVELLTVVVIGGVLSATALPTFLDQQVKAKGMETSNIIGGIARNAAVEFVEGDLPALATGGDCTALGGPADYSPTSGTKHLFDYACDYEPTTGILTISATGNAIDTSVEGLTKVVEFNPETGVSTLVAASTDKVFGGSKTA